MLPKSVNIENLVTQLSGHYRQRREVSYAWSDVISAYMGLSGLRGFWPTSVVGDSGAMIDVSGQGRHLTNNGEAQFSQYNAAYWANTLTTTNDNYFNRADEAGLSITGTETYIDTDKGLSIGCWVNVRATVSAQGVLIGKWDAATNNRSYSIQLTTGRQPLFTISTTGADNYQILAPTTLSTTSWRWKFVCGVFDNYGAGTDQIHIYAHTSTGLRKWTGNVAVGASIFDGTADFTIGAGHGMSLPLPATRVSLAFVCARALNEGTVRALYGISRPLFLTFPNV